MNLPAPGEWPCQSDSDPDSSVRLVSFLYRLLRDGARVPSDVEQIAIDIGRHDKMPRFTNPHLESYARSLAAFLEKQ